MNTVFYYPSELGGGKRRWTRHTTRAATGVSFCGKAWSSAWASVLTSDEDALRTHHAWGDEIRECQLCAKHEQRMNLLRESVA